MGGRSNRYYIKEYEADTNLRLCFVIDVSGSMNFGCEGSEPPHITKLDYARRRTGTLAYLVAGRGVVGRGAAGGLYCAGPDFRREIRPKRTAAHLKFVLDELGSMQAEGETGLPEALHQVAEKLLSEHSW